MHRANKRTVRLFTWCRRKSQSFFLKKYLLSYVQHKASSADLAIADDSSLIPQDEGTICEGSDNGRQQNLHYYRMICWPLHSSKLAFARILPFSGLYVPAGQPLQLAKREGTYWPASKGTRKNYPIIATNKKKLSHHSKKLSHHSKRPRKNYPIINMWLKTTCQETLFSNILIGTKMEAVTLYQNVSIYLNNLNLHIMMSKSTNRSHSRTEKEDSWRQAWSQQARENR